MNNPHPGEIGTVWVSTNGTDWIARGKHPTEYKSQYNIFVESEKAILEMNKLLRKKGV